jgi:hypothetical protein
MVNTMDEAKRSKGVYCLLLVGLVRIQYFYSKGRQKIFYSTEWECKAKVSSEVGIYASVTNSKSIIAR